jgi:nucleoside 2-deoxyribosyltransferase
MCANDMAPREIFLSYNHKDRNLAWKVKQELKKLGFAPFLAHQDISVSAEWRAEILKHLNNCTAVIAIVTENFAESAWTNQEVGIALGKDKPIVSLMFDRSKSIPGFLEALQGVSASEATMRYALKKAVMITSKHRALFSLDQLARRTRPLTRKDEYVQFSDKSRHMKDDAFRVLKELDFKRVRNITSDVPALGGYGGSYSKPVVSATRRVEIDELGFFRKFRFLMDFWNEWPTAFSYFNGIRAKHDSPEYGNIDYNNIWVEVSHGKFRESSLKSRFSSHMPGLTVIPISSNLSYLGTDKTTFQLSNVDRRTVSKLKYFSSIVKDKGSSNHSKFERIRLITGKLGDKSQKAVENDLKILREKVGWSGDFFTILGDLRPGFVVSNIGSRDAIRSSVLLMLDWIADNGHWM